MPYYVQGGSPLATLFCPGMLETSRILQDVYFVYALLYTADSIVPFVPVVRICSHCLSPLDLGTVGNKQGFVKNLEHWSIPLI